ncbi:DUF4097 family beta strand repeat-containing protein [Streptomyces sp. Marseille-Q5077]|uniref:DUF4097 family beta strand repeat-containing protein n=1 Tax=Streptomyces sp. Marseille-Q5077 TaxID=3418995 RepID=UPI003D013ED7
MKTRASAAAALTLMALLAGCTSDDETSESSSYTVKEAVSALNVKSNGGLIELVASDRTTVQVTEKFLYSGSKPKTRHAVSGSTLSLETGGCSEDSSPCEVSYRIEVPRALTVTLNSEGGDAEVKGLAGKLTVDTEGGSATAEQLASTAVRISSGGGDADAAFTSAPDSADVRTDGGDLTVRLPGGSYAVDADGEGGEEKVTVKTDPASSHKVIAKSGGGSVSVTS